MFGFIKRLLGGARSVDRTPAPTVLAINQDPPPELGSLDWLVPPDAYYVISYYPQVLTKSEARAADTLAGLFKTATSKRLRQRQRERGTILDNDPGVLRLLADGQEAFWERLVTRVRAECPEVIWHKCGKCDGLLRTPKARQCLHCGYDWH